MKLTPKEQEICNKYRERDETGLVRCYKCPLCINHCYAECYATIDGRTKEARELKRY